MTEQQFRRGDVVLVNLPFAGDPSQFKVRPAVIIQNDTGNRYSPNLIVAAISSQLPRRQFPTNLIIRRDSPEAIGSGLDRDSIVQAEVILTIPKTSVVARLGRFNATVISYIDGCVRISLGLL